MWLRKKIKFSALKRFLLVVSHCAYRQTDGRTDERTENLPILQDFVPYWGRCPATAQL